MDRRNFLKILPRVAGAAAIGGLMRAGSPGGKPQPAPELVADLVVEPQRDEGAIATPEALGSGAHETKLTPERAVAKARDFDRTYDDDIWVEQNRWDLLVRTTARLERAQRYIGHGNFNSLGFPELIDYGRHSNDIGSFENDELEFLEEIFQADARRYGFLGEKTIVSLEGSLKDRDLKRIAGTGHWLLQGPSLERYEQIRRDLGDSVLLTSGVRGLAKQYHLFLTKAVDTQGNLSQAARSLAPPGYSFHAIGDFDIGKLGLGSDNFTDRFAQTDEFKKLTDLGYVDIRYYEANPFGVRHEPWHIKIS